MTTTWDRPCARSRGPPLFPFERRLVLLAVGRAIIESASFFLRNSLIVARCLPGITHDSIIPRARSNNFSPFQISLISLLQSNLNSNCVPLCIFFSWYPFFRLKRRSGRSNFKFVRFLFVYYSRYVWMLWSSEEEEEEKGLSFNTRRLWAQRLRIIVGRI